MCCFFNMKEAWRLSGVVTRRSLVWIPGPPRIICPPFIIKLHLLSDSSTEEGCCWTAQLPVWIINPLINLPCVCVHLKHLMFVLSEVKAARCNEALEQWRQYRISGWEIRLAARPTAMTRSFEDILYIFFYLCVCVSARPPIWWLAIVNFGPCTRNSMFLRRK